MKAPIQRAAKRRSVLDHRLRRRHGLVIFGGGVPLQNIAHAVLFFSTPLNEEGRLAPQRSTCQAVAMHAARHKRTLASC